MLGLDPVRDAARLRPMIGSQLQASALPDRMRVGEAVELFATSAAQDPDELLERFGLADRHRSPFAGLSGGERQRLFLVLALLNRPRLVVLDELTQGLDPAARRGVWAAVARLRDEGTTVLLVTHELDEAEALCGRVIALRDGRVLDQGAPAELVARHAPWARVEFGSAGADADPLDLLDDLRRLPGVEQRPMPRAGRSAVRGTPRGDRLRRRRAGAPRARAARPARGGARSRSGPAAPARQRVRHPDDLCRRRHDWSPGMTSAAARLSAPNCASPSATRWC